MSNVSIMSIDSNESMCYYQAGDGNSVCDSSAVVIDESKGVAYEG